MVKRGFPTSKRATRERGLRSDRSLAGFGAPRGLEATTLSAAEDEYVLIGFSIAPVEVPAGLSAAERDVVRRVLEGRSNAEIAEARRSSTNTVANQLHSIYGKLGVSGRLELAQRCVAGKRRPAPKIGPSRV